MPVIKKFKYALPSLVTLLSLACGFTSIVISVNSATAGVTAPFQLAAWLLVVAGVFDALDGYVARLTGTASRFGMQLDSVVDAVNFGMAPAVLLYCYGFFGLHAEHPNIHRLGSAACFLFAACGALRLARFNAQIETTDPRYFVGMPITVGAACVASAVVGWPDRAAGLGLAYSLLVLLGLIGFLMVSNLRFPSSKLGKPGGRCAPAMVIFVSMLAIGALFLLKARFFAALFASYTFATLLLNLAWNRFGWRGIEPPLG